MRRVRLTEGQLHRIIRNAVNEAALGGNGFGSAEAFEAVWKRRNSIMNKLTEEGYDVADCGFDDRNYMTDLPYNEFCVNFVSNEDIEDEAKYIKRKFHLEGFKICPNTYPIQCNFYF